MGRVIGGVVLGYIAMFAAVFLALTVIYLLMGADNAFQPESFAPSMIWLVIMTIVSFGAAVLGGLVCARIAPNSRAPIGLVVLVVVMGLISAAGSFQAPDPDVSTVRDGKLGNMEAMMQARTPAWVAILNPVIGAVGVMVGARRKNG